MGPVRGVEDVQHRKSRQISEERIGDFELNSFKVAATIRVYPSRSSDPLQATADETASRSKAVHSTLHEVSLMTVSTCAQHEKHSTNDEDQVEFSQETITRTRLTLPCTQGPLMVAG